jgi:hypothetical protein
MNNKIFSEFQNNLNCLHKTIGIINEKTNNSLENSEKALEIAKIANNMAFGSENIKKDNIELEVIRKLFGNSRPQLDEIIVIDDLTDNYYIDNLFNVYD